MGWGGRMSWGSGVVGRAECERDQQRQHRTRRMLVPRTRVVGPGLRLKPTATEASRLPFRSTGIRFSSYIIFIHLGVKTRLAIPNIFRETIRNSSAMRSVRAKRRRHLGTETTICFSSRMATAKPHELRPLRVFIEAIATAASRPFLVTATRVLYAQAEPYPFVRRLTEKQRR